MGKGWAGGGVWLTPLPTLLAGEVCGTVHCEVLEEVGASLGPGAVVLLRQVSVVSPKPRRHHLNITASNLVALYPAQGGRWTAGGGVSHCTAGLSCDCRVSVV